jgi:hypothetical protein
MWAKDGSIEAVTFPTESGGIFNGDTYWTSAVRGNIVKPKTMTEFTVVGEPSWCLLFRTSGFDNVEQVGRIVIDKVSYTFNCEVSQRICSDNFGVEGIMSLARPYSR